MVSSMLRPDMSLPDALAARARAASNNRLALDVVGGMVVATAILVWRPALWLLPFAATICFAAFGLWGIADREVGRRASTDQDLLASALRFVRVVAAVVGAVAALTLIFGALSVLLGTWIS
jgi:hypothetical protein